MRSSMSGRCVVWIRGVAAVAALTLAGGLVAASSATAGTNYTVTSTTDAPLSNSSGTACVSTATGGACTLRAAIQAADNAGGASTITLPAGTYTLTIASTGADNPANGDLDVKGSSTAITLTGAGASSTIINANHLDRAFAVQAGESLAVSGVTIENGAQNGYSPSDNSTDSQYGGAIYNDGSLSVSASVLADNSAAQSGGAVYADTAATSTSITSSTVVRNTAYSNGGAIFLGSGALTLTGDTLTDSSSDSSGGTLYDDEGGHTVGATMISSTAISDSAADSDGGAVYAYDAGALTVVNSSIDDANGDGYGYGGAIYDEDSGALTVSNSSFSGDYAGLEDGGAIYTDNTDLAVSGSTFDGDGAGAAGALYVYGTSATALETISSSSFVDDSASDDEGGAVYVYRGDLQVSGTTFSDDNASESGGALYYSSGDGLALTDDTFDGNQAGDNGGAIVLSESASTGTIGLLNDTIARNTSYYGGGIYYPSYANVIEDTIVADNSGGSTPDGGGDCYETATTDNAGAADQGGNIDSDGTCFSSAVSHDKTGVNPDLGTLASNGGPTQTDALLAGSPAIGDGVSTPDACPASDQRGVPRGSSCDVGAFQTAAADLALAMSGPSSATAGAPVSYTLTVTNHGPSAATGVSVNDTLPAGATLFSVSASQGSCSGTTTVTCALGTLDSSNTGSTTSATVTIVVIPGSGGTLANSATLSANQSDANSANNTASVSTTVAAASGGTVGGGTLDIPPLVLSTWASRRTATTARLAGDVNPAGEATTYRFQIGKSKRYGKTINGRALTATSTQQRVILNMKSLKPGTTYHFRLVATNANGTTYGADMMFKTRKGKHTR